MHASRNKRGRKLENKNRIGARSLQTPWLRCKSSTDFKRKCRLQAVHWFTANFENEPHSSLLQFNQSLVFFPYVNFDSLRKHPFLFALRRCGHFARKRPQRRRARRNGCFRRLKLWRSCDIVLRCLQNKVEKRINELPELLPSLFMDFMEIKICTLRSFTIVDTTKQEFQFSVASNLLHVDTFLLLMKKSLKWYFLTASLQKWILF